MNPNIVFLILIVLLASIGLYGTSVVFDWNHQSFLITDWSRKDVAPAPVKPQPRTPRQVISDAGREQGVRMIRYTGSGFLPRVATISRGGSVRFVNQSGGAMRISIVRTGGGSLQTEYTDAQSVGNGGMYELSIPEPGVWTVKDLTKGPTSASGVLYVQ